MIVVTEPRVFAWLGFAVCLAMISVFYYTFTIAEGSSILSPHHLQTGPDEIHWAF